MSNTDLFTADPEFNLPSVDPDKDYLPEFVGDDKKFKTASELARGKAESDAFIERLKFEAAELRKELKQRMSMEDFIDRMNKNPSTNTVVPPVTNQGELVNKEPANTNKSLTQEDLERLLSERESKTREESNLQLVAETLERDYGKDYKNVVAQRMKELGIGQEFLADLAKKQPKAFINLIGNPKKEDQVQQPNLDRIFTSSSTTSVSKPQDAGVKNYTYWQKLRKEDPVRYFNPTVAWERDQIAQKMGEAFFR